MSPRRPQRAQRRLSDAGDCCGGYATNFLRAKALMACAFRSLRVAIRLRGGGAPLRTTDIPSVAEGPGELKEAVVDAGVGGGGVVVGDVVVAVFDPDGVRF